MNPLERAISLIAPHICTTCNKEGNLLCESCSNLLLARNPSRCYRCHKATVQNKTCLPCRKKTGIAHVWPACSYNSAAKELVYKLKFDRAKSASSDIARIIALQLPILPSNVLISHIPTVNKRVRIRGYDQAQLIAKDLAKLTGLEYKALLLRQKSARQVGAKRKDRFTQLENAFLAPRPDNIAGQHVLLVDDVSTTGATIESAAGLLRKNKAKLIDVAVFAQP